MLNWRKENRLQRATLLKFNEEQREKMLEEGEKTGVKRNRDQNGHGQNGKARLLDVGKFYA